MHAIHIPIAAAVTAVALLSLGACTANDHDHDHDAGMDLGTETLTADGAYRVRYTPEPDPIPLNEGFDLRVEVEPASGGALKEVATVRVDATMPAHGHGMNTAPEVTRDEAGHFVVDGMLFHMPGHWEIYVDVEEDGASERATFHVVLEE